MQQAQDFLAESRALDSLLLSHGDDVLDRVTQFKQWSIDDVIGHLHFWNRAARLSLQDAGAFSALLEPLAGHLAAGGTLKEYERVALDGLSGPTLLAAWREEYVATAAAFSSADPAARVAWAGPTMSARSAISARQMETWAHGHEVFDVLGAVRDEADRIRNIVVLGVNTYDWSFNVRHEEVPAPKPEVVLLCPSGDTWRFGEPQPENRISGTAVEFAQVVTQTRSVADTALQVTGDAAIAWMARAQCFAGAPSAPPQPGERYKVA